MSRSSASVSSFRFQVDLKLCGPCGLEGHDVGCGGQVVQRTGDRGGKLRNAVEIDLRGFDAVVAEQFLHLGDAGPAGEQICGEAVAEGVGADAFGKADATGGDFERFPQRVFMDVVTANDAAAVIGAVAGGRPEPEPRPFSPGVGIFAFEVVGQVNGRRSGGTVGGTGADDLREIIRLDSLHSAM